MGLNWNAKGTKTVDDLIAALKGEAPKPPAPAVHPPPPPPPPAHLPPPPPPVAPAAQSGPVDRTALFEELNQGEDITKRFRFILYLFHRPEKS